MIWTDLTSQQKVDAVRQAVQVDGLSYGQAAKQFGVVRNAIAGVIERSANKEGGKIQSAFKQPPMLKGSQGGRTAVKQEKARRARRGLANKFVADAIPDELIDRAGPRLDAWEPLPGSRPVSLVDLGPQSCRWPLGDRPMLFCALPVEGEHIYCAEHRAMGTRPLPVVRKNSQPLKHGPAQR